MEETKIMLNFLKNALQDMKKSAKAQREVDKAEFQQKNQRQKQTSRKTEDTIPIKKQKQMQSRAGMMRR